jgi:hypothetical protein
MARAAPNTDVHQAIAAARLAFVATLSFIVLAPSQNLS